MEIASAVEQMVLLVDLDYEKDQTNAAGTLIIHDPLIPDPFSLKTMKNFHSSPPLGIFEIFNHLIYHSTNYNKHGLTTYKSFDDNRLFNDGYMEPLLTVQLKQEGVHVYVAKVKPFMKLKMHEGRDH